MNALNAHGAARSVVRSYQPADEPALLRVWNAALYADPIDAARWRRKVLLDPNFQPDGCLVAEADGEVRGFLLSSTRRVPYFDDGLQAGQGWITAFGVEPAWQGHGLGGVLLDGALRRLRGLGRGTVLLGPYIPHYFAPGADIAAYARGVEFLVRRDFEEVERPLDMQASLIGFRIPDQIRRAVERLLAEGVVVRPVAPPDIVPVVDFVQGHFSANWAQGAREVLAAVFAGDPRQVGMLVAVQRNAVLGYAQHEGADFGPLGVRPDLRGRGIAKVLVAAMLAEMLEKGIHAACIHWTFDAAARLYEQCGFRKVRRFVMLRKAL